MIDDDRLSAARRRFLEWLQEEEIWRDRAGREVGRFVRAVTIDPIGGTAVIRRHADDAPGDFVRLEVGLDALQAAWPLLVQWGRNAFALDSDEGNALGYLLVLLDEVTDSVTPGPVDDVDEYGPDDLVLRSDGLFGAR